MKTHTHRPARQIDTDDIFCLTCGMIIEPTKKLKAAIHACSDFRGLSKLMNEIFHKHHDGSFMKDDLDEMEDF